MAKTLKVPDIKISDSSLIKWLLAVGARDITAVYNPAPTHYCKFCDASVDPKELVLHLKAHQKQYDDVKKEIQEKAAIRRKEIAKENREEKKAAKKKKTRKKS